MMNVNNKYFDVVIDNNSFYITESSSKPKIHDSAIATLAKIETVVKNQLEYSVSHQDDYSKLSKIDVLEILNKKSSEIYNGYKEKQSKLNWIARKIFSKEKKIKAIHARIENHIIFPQALPLSNELIQEIAKHLGISDLAALAQLNRQGQEHAISAIVKRARKFGYEGENNNKASEYLKDLFKEVEILSKQRIIPKKYLAYTQKKFQAEKTLHNLQGLSAEDIFTLLANEKLYSSSFQKFRNIFNLKKNWKASKTYSDSVKQKGSEALVLAAKNNDKNRLEFLIQHGADPNAPLQNCNPPLHHAAQAGYVDIVELLLKRGARVNEQAQGHNTALAFACGYGDRKYHKPNAKVVELLLLHGADPNIPSQNGAPPLYHAAQVGYADVVELLLKHGARVNEQALGHDTALAFACGYGDRKHHKPNAKVVELLLLHGADPNAPLQNGNPPLHHAAQAGYADIVELLLKHGAKANEQAQGHNTALAFACGYGDRKYHKPNAKVVELLLLHGADPNIPSQNGAPPLYHAAQVGYADVVELLLKHGARVNEQALGHDTALAFACGYGDRKHHKPNAKVVELLLLHGADPNAPLQNGNPPLHHAAQAGYADIVELLLKHGAKANEQAQGHNTALAFACGYGDRKYHKPNAKVVELLLRHGADPNIPSQNGSTPLKIARKYKFLEIISLLLNHNAHQ